MVAGLFMLASSALWVMHLGRTPVRPPLYKPSASPAARTSASTPAGPHKEAPIAVPEAGAPVAERNAPSAPRVQPGQRVEVSLSEPAAQWYMRGATGGNERFYRQLVRDIGGKDAIFSADMGRAAREFVFQYTELGVQPPSDIRDFLVRSSGAIAGDTSFQHVRTTSDTEKSLRRAISAVLRDPPDGVGPVTVGIGELFTPGQRYSRHIGVVATRRPAVLEPVPRKVELDTPWLLKGQLLIPWKGLKALVLRPDGTTEELTPERDGPRFSVVVMSGNRPGPMDVQFVGEGPRGPGKLFQVRAEVGRNLPQRFVTTLPPDETTIDTADKAAAFALSLLNADRARHDLPALLWDDALASVARAHSADMRDNHFFSHRSPSTGLHTERLARSGYRAVASAENLAMNVSIHEAEQGLMHSLGHRRNILDPHLTHVGIGVAGEERGEGHRRWWVTQLFSRPVRDIEPAHEAARLLETINAARADSGRGAVAADANLDLVAETAARAAASGDLQGVTQAALDDARDRGLLHGRLRAWAAMTPELSRLELPGMLREPSVKRLGIGVFQARDPGGAIGLVLLVAE